MLFLSKSIHSRSPNGVGTLREDIFGDDSVEWTIETSSNLNLWRLAQCLLLARLPLTFGRRHIVVLSGNFKVNLGVKGCV